MSKPSLVQEFMQFLWREKWWWIVPLALILAILGVVLATSDDTVGPFVYGFF